MTKYKAVQVDVGKSQGSVQTGNFLSPAALLCCAPDNFGSSFPNHFYFLHIPLGQKGWGEQECLQGVRNDPSSAGQGKDTSLIYLQATLILMNVDYI